MTYVLARYLLCTAARYLALYTNYFCAVFRGSILNKDPCCGYTSVNSKPPTPPGKPTGNFFEVVKNPVPGQKFSTKRLRGKKAPAPGEYFRRSSQPFPLISVKVLEFCRNQTLKGTERLSNYSLIIPSSFSSSTIIKVLM